MSAVSPSPDPWSARWRDDALERLELRTPSGAVVQVRPRAVEHPILGLCDALVVAGETSPRCLGTALDWHAPSFIPALDRPGALPPGAGTAVINVIATFAKRAGRERLRYRGPYPSASLFDTLLQSFRTATPPADALPRFIADAEARMLAPTLAEVPVDFTPAPHTWSFPAPALTVQHRDGIERVFVHGVPFERDRIGHRRIVPRDDGSVQLRIEVAGELWAVTGELDRAGIPQHLDLTPPPAPPALEGLPLVPELAAILTQIAARNAPRFLAPLIAGRTWPMRFANTGWSLAQMRDGVIELHARLAQRLEHDPAAVLEVLAQNVEPLLLRAAQHELARANDG